MRASVSAGHPHHGRQLRLFAASGPDGDRSGRPGWLRGVLGWSDPYRGRPARQYMRTLQSAYLAIKARSPEVPEVIAKELEAAFRRWTGTGRTGPRRRPGDDASAASG